MRRKIWILGLLLGCILLYAACSSDGPATDVNAQAIRFAVSSATDTGGETRTVVDGNYLPVADAVGVFAYSYVPSSSSAWQPNPDLYDNAQGVVGDVPQGDARQTITLPEKYYISGCHHAFYSYYPYRSSLSASSPVLEADLFSTLETDNTQTDWLWADPIIDMEVSPSPVPLTYSHAMTLVRIAVAKRAEVDATLKVESITLGTSSSQKFTFDVSSGVVEGVSGGSTQYTESLVSFNEGVEEHFVVPPLESGESLASKVASRILLLPQSVVTSLGFRVNGEDFSTPDDWVGFSCSTGGKFRFVSILLGVNEITIQLGGQDWGDGSTTDLSQSEVTISLGAKGWDYDPATDIDMSQSGITIPLGAQGWLDYSGSIKVK